MSEVPDRTRLGLGTVRALLERMQLGGTLDIRTVGAVLDEARRLCAAGEPFTVDGSTLESCDSAGAQLLVALATAKVEITWRLSAALERELTDRGISLERFSRRTS